MPITNWTLNYTNITDFGQVPALANTATGGMFWVSIVHMIFIVLTLMLMYQGIEVALIVSSIACLFLSLILSYAGLLSWVIVLEFAAIPLVLILYITFSNRYR